MSACDWIFLFALQYSLVFGFGFCIFGTIRGEFWFANECYAALFRLLFGWMVRK